MEKDKREKIVIKDSKREEEMVVYSDHPFFDDIKNYSLMPDEYRKETAKLWYWDPKNTEEAIDNYYKSIEDPEWWMQLVELIVQKVHWDQVPSDDWDCIAKDDTKNH